MVYFKPAMIPVDPYVYSVNVESHAIDIQAGATLIQSRYGAVSAES
ncbi:MAG TPA: hypothetical protein VK619_12365 [Pyrinomonadaceae bacterium]|nr:hypothetical protein [Pyrinomonadaceae bacterium]